jgi:hypothetical protein
MNKTALATFLFICSGLTHAQPHITGMWQAEVEPGIFWTVELQAEGSRLTGTVHDRVDAVDFYDGTISGNSIAFKVTTLLANPPSSSPASSPRIKSPSVVKFRGKVARVPSPAC